MEHGKPLGLGSVKVTVDSVEIRDFDLEKLSYRINTIEPSHFLEENPFESDSEYYKDFMAIVNFKTLEKHIKKSAVISYPIGDDGQNNKNSKASH